MLIPDTSRKTAIRYEPEASVPYSSSFGQGIMAALLVFPTVVLVPTVVVRASGLDVGYLTWCVFAACLVAGLVTLLQGLRAGPIGAGYVLISSSAATSIAVCILALSEGGVTLLMNLVIAAALFQMLLSARLSWIRQVISPVISGLVLMLITVDVMPVVFDMLATVPEGVSPYAAPGVAVITLLTLIALAFGTQGALRLWAPVIALVAGSVVSVMFGLYNISPALDASWFSLPLSEMPEISLSLDAGFWTLLPAFLFVTLANTMGNVNAGIAVQQVSTGESQAVDFRSIQRVLMTNGLGDIGAGLLGTIPARSDTSSVNFIQHTGMAARRLGVCIGVVLILLAFLPKLAAVLMTIPAPVVAAYLAVAMAMVFIQGLKLVVQDDIDYRKVTVVGLAFCLGISVHNQVAFGDLTQAWGGLLGNTMSVGGVSVVLLTIVMKLTSPRRYSITTALDTRVLHRLKGFLGEHARRIGWSEAATERLFLIGEETLLSLSEGSDKTDEKDLRTLMVTLSNDRNTLELEFVSAIGEDNLEDQMRLLGDHTESTDGHEISLRILQHYASSVRHQQYHNMDVVTVRVTEDESD